MLRRTLPTAERTVTPGKAKRKQEAIDKEGAIRGACLVRSHMNAGQNGIRDESSKQESGFMGGHWLFRSVSCLGSIDRTIFSLSCKFWHQLSTVAVRLLPVSG